MHLRNLLELKRKIATYGSNYMIEKIDDKIMFYCKSETEIFVEYSLEKVEFVVYGVYRSRLAFTIISEKLDVEFLFNMLDEFIKKYYVVQEV